VSTEQLLRLSRRGFRPAQIADRSGLPRGAVYLRLRRLRQRGLLPPTAPPTAREPNRTILELCRAGLWPGEIAARTGIPARAISHRLSKLRRRGVGVPMPAGPRPAHNRRVTDEELLAFIHTGLRPAEIAAGCGMATMAVYARLRALRRRGLLAGLPPPLPRRGRKGKPYTDEQILSLARLGLRGPHIARHLGISRATVGRRLRELRQRGCLGA